MSISNPWTTLRKSEPFTCPYFTIRTDVVSHAGGEPRPYHSIRMKVFGVAVLPVDEEGCTTLVGQHRYVLDRFSWELPGGGARHDGAAVRYAEAELREETGYRAEKWLEIVDTYVAPGTIDEATKGFVAWGLRKGEPAPEPEEKLILKRIKFADAVSMALSGEIGHVTSVATLLSLQARLLRHQLPEDLLLLLRE